MKRRIGYAVTILVLSIILAGCGAALQTFIENDLGSQIETRVNANLAYVDKLSNAGLITKEKAKKLKKDINDNGDNLKKSFKNLSSSSGGTADMYKAITGLRYYDASDANIVAYATAVNEKVTPATQTDPAKVEDVSELMLGNYLVDKEGFSVNGWNCSYGWYLRDSVDKDNAVDIVSIDNNSLAISGNFDIYVIDSTKIDQTGDTGKTIDRLKEIFDKYISTSGVMSIQAQAELDKIYKKVDGQRLFDGFNADNLICTTKTQDTLHDGILGYDLEIKQGSNPVLRIRLNEFNQEAVDNLIYMVSSESGKFILSPKDSRAYLVEYPVKVLNKISVDDSGNVTATLKKSDLAINVRSGQIIKYTQVSGQVMPDRTVVGNNITDYTSYLGTYGSDNEHGKSCSSFCVLGEQKVEIEKGYKGQELSQITETRKIKTAAIVLRDYLEASYAPSFTSGSENVVLFGRKFRLAIDGLSGTELKLKNQGIAYMVDVNGDEVKDADGNVIKLNYDQLMALNTKIVNGSVGDSTYCVKRLRRTGETGGKEVQKQANGIGNNPKITELQVIAEDSIKPVLRFPSNKIGSVDYPEDKEQPVMYAIGTCTDLFETGLYSSWINSSSPTTSLSWWNQWLKTMEFKYTVNSQAVEDYLVNNYSYELTQEGVVMVDLDTVALIQQDVDKLNNTRGNDIRRTVFKILGLALTLYSVLLAICWVIDTQVGFGIDLYKIVSLGRWQAMKYKSDIPVGDNENRYVALGRMIANSMIIMTVGVVILRVNIVVLIYRVIASFGRIAQQLSNLL